MKWVFAVFVALLAMFSATIPAAAQPLSVYSEFARIDAQGNVVAPETPREILSPALVRNGFTSFQVVAQVPPGAHFMLTVGQNPSNAAKVTLYRAADSRLKRIADPAEGEGSEIFWMDVWIDKEAPVRRIKVEPQLYVEGDWVIYPMEMRVRENMVPEDAPPAAGASPFEMLRAYLCNGASARVPSTDPSSTAADPATVDDLHVRNARQDIALASLLPLPDRDELRKRMGGCKARAPEDPEFYLRLRDYFFTPLWMKVAHGN